MSKTLDSEKMLRELILNAIDFMKTAEKEIDERPKYSVISFYTAIELFLKARLMAEHWTLILEQPDKASIDDFKRGDFKSVNIDQSINRLDKILKARIRNEAKKTFEVLRQHRNHLIHFFHHAYSDTPSEKTIGEITREQLACWFYLHPLLTKDWKDIFAGYFEEIEKLHQSFAKRKEYWNFKYNQLKPDIEKGQENGTNFYYCWLCGYKSRKIKSIEVDPLLVYGSCLVCEDTKLELLVPCMKHDCEGHILSPDIYSGICSTCESQIEDDNPIEKLISELDNIFAVCTECDWLGEGTVIGYGIESEEKYVCLNCLTEYHADSLEQCPYCGRWFAGGVNELGICYECHDVTLANFGE